MKIGVDIRPLMTAPKTGVGEYTFELLDAVFNIDRKNQYFLFYNSGQNVSANIPNWKFDNVKIIDSHIPNKIFNSLLRIFKQPKLDNKIGGCDVWWSPNLNFTALSKKTKHILTVHDLSFEFFPEFSTTKQKLWHKMVQPEKQCQKANLILVPSENTKRDIVNYYQIEPEKIKVIYPGIKEKKEMGSKEEVDKKYNLPEKYILFLGTIEPRKNIVGLIKAFEEFCLNQTSQYSLVIAGAPGWKNKRIYKQAKKSKYTKQIQFIGFVEDRDKPTLYANAEIFVYPSLYEGFGFPVLEAMKAGTAVITSNRSSLPEIAGSAAYLIDPNRPEQIAKAMKNLITNQNLRQWHVVKGQYQAKKFTWQKAAEEWLEFVTNLLY